MTDMMVFVSQLVYYKYVMNISLHQKSLPLFCSNMFIYVLKQGRACESCDVVVISQIQTI